MAQTTLDKRMLGSQSVSTDFPAVADLTDVTIATSDILRFGDSSDSNATKKDTVQGLLDLAGGGSWSYLSSAILDASDASDDVSHLTFDFATGGTDWANTWDVYRVTMMGMHGTSGSSCDFYCQTKDDAGPAWEQGDYYYCWGSVSGGGTSGYSNGDGNITSVIVMMHSIEPHIADAGGTVYFFNNMSNPHHNHNSNNRVLFDLNTRVRLSSPRYNRRYFGEGTNENTSTYIAGVRFYWSSGNIKSGMFRLDGMKLDGT